jgi:hypothetical protein
MPFKKLKSKYNPESVYLDNKVFYQREANYLVNCRWNLIRHDKITKQVLKECNIESTSNEHRSNE